MKPRIFINMHYMAIGGAERALLGLLNALDLKRVDVDLFLNQHSGELMKSIPKNVNILPEKNGYNAIERSLKTILKEGQLSILYGRVKARIQHKIYYNSLDEKLRKCDSSTFQYIANAVDPHLPSLDYLGEYDLAISFLQPHNIVLKKVKAKKKIAWIHTDYSSIHVNADLEFPVWSGFDRIVSISPDCTRGFLKVFPSLENKIIEVENILSPSLIREESLFDNAHEFEKYDGIKLLSVGRYDYAKNYDNIPDILFRILPSYPNIKWFIIGFGGDEQLIRNKIDEANMNDKIILLGKKSNPYPYIRKCDIYVQPSRFEGKSITVREAQILCKPVIVTNYKTANSQIKDGIDGIIVPMDNENCAKGIINAISSKEKLKSIVDYLHTHDYGNEDEVKKIYKLLE